MAMAKAKRLRLTYTLHTDGDVQMTSNCRWTKVWLWGGEAQAHARILGLPKIPRRQKGVTYELVRPAVVREVRE